MEMIKTVARITMLATLIGSANLLAVRRGAESYFETYHPKQARWLKKVNAAKKVSDSPLCRLAGLSSRGSCDYGQVITLEVARAATDIDDLEIGDSWVDEYEIHNTLLEPSLEAAKSFCDKARERGLIVDDDATRKDL
jgi:hypothetical protein